MYTRCPSIAGLFRTAVLLKDTKCNKINQRRMHSETIIKFSKIETKLKPMKRYFSGAPNNRISLHKTRHIQGLGYIRKNLPTYPREMLQQEPLSLGEQMPPNVNQGISMSSQSLNENTSKSGKITIVIDKNEICSCASPGEDIQIHVTTKLDSAGGKTVRRSLSETRPVQLCSTKCRCCPQCEEVKNFKIESSTPMGPNPIAFQPTKALMTFPNHLPRRQNNVYDLPVRNFARMGERRPVQMVMLRKSRSMSDFPAMRKLVGPFDNVEPRIPQSATKLHNASINDVRSKSRTIFTSSHYNQQQRNSQPQQNATPHPLSNQQRDNSQIVIPYRQVISRRVHQMNQRLGKYSSFHQNILPGANDQNNNSNARQGKQQKDENETSRNRPKGDQQQPKPMRITQKVIRPATFSSFGRVVDGRSITNTLIGNVVNPTVSQPTSPNQTLRSPLMAKPFMFNMQKSVSKNRHPAVRASLPKMLTFQNQNEFIAPKRAYASQDNFTASRTHFLVSRRSPLLYLRKRSEVQPSMNRPASNSLKQRSSTSPSQGHFTAAQKMLHQQNFFLVQRQPPPLHLKKRSELQSSVNLNHQINNRVATTNAPKNLIPTVPMLVRPNHPIRFDPRKLPPQFFLKSRSTVSTMQRNRLIATQRSSRLVKPNQRISAEKMKQPPQFFLKKRIGSMQQDRKKHFQRPQARRGSIVYDPRRGRFQRNVSINRNRNLPRIQNVHPKILSNVRKSRTPTGSMIPVRNIPPQQTMAPNNFPQQISVVPFEGYAAIQNKTIAQPQQVHRNIILDSRRQTKAIEVKRTPPPNNHPRMNANHLQSSLPIAIASQQNRAGENIDRPKSVQDVRRPYSNEANAMVKRPYSNQAIVNPTRIPVPVIGRKSLPEDRQQMTQLRQKMEPMQSPKSLPQGTQTLPMNCQKSSPQMCHQTPIIPTVNPRLPQVYQQMPLSRQIIPQMNSNKDLSQERSSQPNTLRSMDSQLAIAAPEPKVDNSNSKANNPAVLFSAPGRLELVELPVPRLPDEKGVIVKMLYVHLTDFDTQILSDVQDGPYKLSQPTIAGKSGSGVVVDAGDQVDNVKIGDKVSVKGIFCGKCTACENDNEVMCERVQISDKLGILKRFHAVPAKFVTRLPDSVNPIDAAMIDELSTSIRACKKSAVTAGDNVLILGGKSLGLWTALAAKSMGATKVCLAGKMLMLLTNSNVNLKSISTVNFTDSRPLLLDQAKKVDIERTFLMNPDLLVSDTSKAIVDYLDKENPRIVFDCNGSPFTNEIAIKTSQIGGKVVLMKNSIPNKPILLSDAIDREVDILSSQHGNNDSERAALQLLSSGKVKLNGMKSSFFDITNVHEAFRSLNSGTISNVFIQPSRLDDGDDHGKKKS